MSDIREFHVDDMDPLPKGTYKAVICTSEVRDSKSGGKFLSLTPKIIEGEYSGKTVQSVNLNFVHSNPKAVIYAKIEFGKIRQACGLAKSPNNSAELHNIPMMIDVDLEPRQDTGELVNKIIGWHKVANGMPDKIQAVEVGKDTPPW